MKKDVAFNRSLTLAPVVFFGLAYMAPMAVFTTYGVATSASHGMLPSAYTLALVAMLFTAFSYGRMVKAYPTAGSAYTYTQKTISPHAGFMVGWSVLMDYLFLPMLCNLIVAIYLTAAFPSVPRWIRRMAGPCATRSRASPQKSRRFSPRTSPTSTGRCSPWSTFRRRSRGRCSPAIPDRRSRCGGCSSMNSRTTSPRAAPQRR